MVFGLGNIVSNFSNTVGSFVGFLAFGKTGPYTHVEGVTNRVIPGHWKLNLPYSFRVDGVFSSILGASSPLSGLFNVIGTPFGGGMFDEFQLPINPQQITQDEIFAINITPTQKGIVAEHNGVVFKDLVIAGTTGQRPTNNQSGYELFQQLRNYFRSYAQLKKSPDQKFSQLLFINRKDNETLVVEPVKFSMERSKDAPFLYNYNIVLKVLGGRRPFFGTGILGEFFTTIDQIIQTATDLVYGVRNIANNTRSFVSSFKRDIYRTYVEPFEAINLAFKSIRGDQLNLVDMPESFQAQLSEKTVKNFLDRTKILKANGDIGLSDVTLPANTAKEAAGNTANALNSIPWSAKEQLSISVLTTKEKTALNELIKTAVNQPRSFYEELLVEVVNLRDLTLEKFGLKDSDYADFVGYTDNFSPEEYDDSTPLTNEKMDVLSGFNQAERALNMILSTNELFESTLDQYVGDVIENYDNQLKIGGANSVDELILPANATLEQLAMEYLGSAERWIDIAILNNLVSPYIDINSTSIRVKRPGEKILIPRAIVPELSNIPNTKTIKISEGLTETERNLGVDLKMRLNDSTFDFIMNNNNDFELIASGENAGQALLIKLALEKGSLKYHPQIGVGLGIGEKIRQGIDIRDDIMRSILSDTRFTNIKNMSFITEGSTIKINLEVVVKHLLTPVPLSLSV